MIEEEGVMTEISGSIAKVAILKKTACESCAAAGACHPKDNDRSILEASNPVGASEGQKVKVALAPQVYLKASIILYGIPMVALVSGAILAKNLSIHYLGKENSDLWAFLAGMGTMIASFAMIKIYNNKVAKTQKYKPVIVEILE